MQRHYAIRLSKNSYPDKASGKKAGYYDCIKQPIVELPLDQIADSIAGSHQKQFFVSAFDSTKGDDGHHHAGPFQYADLIGLDFDNTTGVDRFDGFIQLSRDINLIPAIVYHSQSSTSKREKFRAIYALDERIYDVGVYHTLIASIRYLVRSQHSDHNPIYYSVRWNPGTRHQLLEDFTPIKLGGLLTQIETDAKYDPYRHGRRMLETYLEKFVTLPTCIRPALDSKCGFIWSELPADKTIAVGGKYLVLDTPDKKVSKKRYNKTAGDAKREIRHKLSETQIIYLRDACKAMDRLYSGGKLCNKARTHIVCNMLVYEGMKAECDKHPDFLDNDITGSCIRYNWKCTKCENWCPFYSECETRPTTIRSIIDQKTSRDFAITELPHNTTFMPLDDYRAHIQTVQHNILNSRDGRIHLLLADTGAGKTEGLARYQSLQGICMAFPTHDLTREVYDRLLDAGHDYVERWDVLDDIPDEAIRNHYNMLRDLGVYNAEKVLHEDLRAFKETLPFGDERLVQLESLFKKLANRLDIRDASSAVMTHDKLAMIGRMPNIHTYVIDECNMHGSLKQVRLTPEELDAVILKIAALPASDGQQQILAYLDAIKQMPKPKKFHGTALNLKQYTKIKGVWNATVTAELASKHAIRNLSLFDLAYKTFSFSNGDYITVFGARTFKPLPDATYLIQTAYADPALYKQIYGDRLEVHDMRGMIAPAGKIYHHPGNWSRSAMMKRKDVVGEINASCERYGVQHQIPFYKYREYLDDVFTHHGATEGKDGAKGCVVGVWGDPHRAPFVATVERLLLEGINAECPVNIPTRMALHKIENGWFRYILYSACNQKERRLQVSFIEGAVIQAVGRSRYMTNPAGITPCVVRPSRCPILNGYATLVSEAVM